MYSLEQISSDWPTFHDLMVAHKSCRLHKPASVSQIRFEAKLAENILNLQHQIHSGSYKPSPAKCFVVTHPKPREIVAAEFRDRIVHHLVVTQLEPVWSRKFINSSFACRIGKGTHGAIRHLQKKVRIISRGGMTSVWCLQMDVEKFFVSIDRPILCELLLKFSRHRKLRELIQAIYGHDARIGVKRCSTKEMFALIPTGKSWFDQGPNRGIPMGNLTSQFGANVYLTELDHFIERTLKPKSYLRYMDDLLFLDTDSKKLEAMVDPVSAWLENNRNQKMNPAKTSLTELRYGINYLGFEFRQMNSAKEPLQVFSTPKKRWQLIQSLRKFESSPPPEAGRPHPLSLLLPDLPANRSLASINSRIGCIAHANTYRFRKKSLQKFIENTCINGHLPAELSNTWSIFKVKKDYRSIKLR